MFIIDEFSFDGDKTAPSQIGGGGTYAAIGARIWLPPDDIGMIVDRGHDWSSFIQGQLERYGETVWLFRDNPSVGTTRAMNTYVGDTRNFEYLTPRIRISPTDLISTPLSRPTTLHFICSPQRAQIIMEEVQQIDGWNPTTIYEPIPDRCVPEELPALQEILPHISILSPNAEEALNLLSIPDPPTKANIELAAAELLGMGIGSGFVIVRSGALGAYVTSKEKGGKWVDAYWREDEAKEHVIDVTGAGNSFLGGLSAGLKLTGDVYEAMYYASVSASFIVEQGGLARISSDGAKWNDEAPQIRLDKLRSRGICTR